MNRQRVLLALWACAAGCASSPPPPATETDAPPPAPAVAGSGEGAPNEVGFFTEEQAERGRATFREICSECHYSSEFRGTQFVYEWRRRTVRDLFRSISRTMPDDAPGTLAPGQYADVISYILRMNGLPAGERELPADAEVLRAYPLAGLGPSGG